MFGAAASGLTPGRGRTERAGSEAIDTGTWQAAMHNAARRWDLMLRMVDVAQPDIWVETCPVCHGTFFDAGEFTDLKEHAVGKLLRRPWRERARRGSRRPESLRSYQERSGRALMPCSRMLAATTDRHPRQLCRGQTRDAVAQGVAQ